MQDSILNNWFHIPEPQVKWLVDGLIPADSSTAAVGKPKAGKSAFIRNLVVSVLKGRPLFNRSVDIPANTGRVLYLHFDRKDKPWRVTKELKELGVTEAESDRIFLRFEKDMKSLNYDERLKWLQREVVSTNPHLLVIDLLWQFVVAKNSNDYTAVLTGINMLQDALNECGYKGALIVATHGRKATSATDAFDDILGSTGQRGSFSTLLMFTHYKKEKRYTVCSDQTERDDVLGEIDETIVIRNPDRTLQLGQSVADIAKVEHKNKMENDLQRLVLYVTDHPGIEMDGILDGLSVSKKYALNLLREASAFIRKEGSGVKGDAYKYYDREYEVSQ